MKRNLTEKNINAFTLAEVLITLLIIGVVASLIIPALINDTQNAELRTAWKKTFADFSQASRRLAIDNGGNLANVFNGSNDVRNEFLPYLSSVKNCNVNSALGPDGCWDSQIYNLSGTDFDYWTIGQWSRMVLNNGMLVAFAMISPDCTNDRATNKNGCATIAVDVNGFKKPNTVGKDIFFSYLTKNGNLEAFGKPGDVWTSNQDGCDLSLHSNAYGFTCATLYLKQ